MRWEVEHNRLTKARLANLLASRALTWSGPKGGQIGVGFDDEQLSLKF